MDNKEVIEGFYPPSNEIILVEKFIGHMLHVCITWNDVMPVVEKITSLKGKLGNDDEYKYEISKNHCWFYYDTSYQETVEICNIEASSTIEAVWQSVIDFIKFYNTTK